MTATKTFSDLVFNDHPNNPDGIQARLDLGNNIEISVVAMRNGDKGSDFMGSLYGNADAGTYEVAVFHNDSMLPLSPFDEVLGWQTEDDLTELMANLQGYFRAQFIANLYIERDEARADLNLDH